jgi:RHS repeat-associated protein
MPTGYQIKNPNTWQLKAIDITNALANLNAMQPRFDRGYTGHEHMAGFGLINMNGRLYDQRFLSPDNVVQSPGNAQNYNRYSYCMNNPLMYVDPTGWNMYFPNGDDVSGGSGVSQDDDPNYVCRGDKDSFGGSTSGTEYWNGLYYDRESIRNLGQILRTLGSYESGGYWSAETGYAEFDGKDDYNLIPIAGWAVAGGIGLADAIWGNQFYNWVELNLRKIQ